MRRNWTTWRRAAPAFRDFAQSAALRILAAWSMVSLLMFATSGVAQSSAIKVTGHRSEAFYRDIRVFQGDRGLFTPRFALPRSPLAHAASVSSVIPPFTLRFIYNALRASGRLVPNKVRLTGFYMYPVSPTAVTFGGCRQCTGPGRFANTWSSIVPLARKLHLSAGHFGVPRRFWSQRYSVLIHGKMIVTGRTRFIQLTLSQRDQIGRFAVYGLKSDVLYHPGLKELFQGCFPSNLLPPGNGFTAKDNYVADHWDALPRVPCRQSLPRHDHLSIEAPLGFSQPGTKFTVSGDAGETEWMTQFFVPGASSCRSDAMSEAAGSFGFFQKRVAGHFSVELIAAVATRNGELCAYLQAGGRAGASAVNGPLADGRVTATAKWFYLGGDRVAIQAPSSAVPGETVNVTYTGRTSVSGETLYAIGSSSPCATTAQAQFLSNPSDTRSALPYGTFELYGTITLPADATGTVYDCAYMQLAPPSGPTPTGETLATATAAIAVTGSSATASGDGARPAGALAVRRRGPSQRLSGAHPSGQAQVLGAYWPVDAPATSLHGS
jgi:hypothetical protein